MKNIILIGFMGTGKSSVGALLASKLGASFIDLDNAVESKYDMTISEMFEKYGEDFFRKCEKETVKEIASRKNTVIATGGGTVKDEENREILSDCGFIVALKASADVVYERTVKEGTRPLLDNLNEVDRRKKIADLMQERQSIYETADLSILTDDMSPMQAVDEIMRFLKVRRG